jgi:predicted nucleic acid-binding protein
LRGRKVHDLLIAAAAERVQLTVPHDDRDFEYIATITGQTHQWIVPAGAID